MQYERYQNNTPGRNVKRFREMLGLKQEGLALELGEDWTQRGVGLLEGKEETERQLLEQVAKVLKVPVEAIKNFDEGKAFNIISNTFNSNESSCVRGNNFRDWQRLLKGLTQDN